MQRARTTLIIDQELLQRAKKNALEMRKTLTEYVEDALRLREKVISEAPRVYDVPTFRGSGRGDSIDISKVNSGDALLLSDDELFEKMRIENDPS